MEAARLAAQGHPFVEAQKQVKALMTGEPRWANVRPPLLPYDRAKAEALGRQMGLLG